MKPKAAFRTGQKIHDLVIIHDDDAETYAAISVLLGKKPDICDVSPAKGIWTYRVVTDDEDDYFDFINAFLDILEGKFDALAELGIPKKDIIFWLIYEYDGQCSLSFCPQEMQRLGESSIALNIDCHALKPLE